MKYAVPIALLLIGAFTALVGIADLMEPHEPNGVIPGLTNQPVGWFLLGTGSTLALLSIRDIWRKRG